MRKKLFSSGINFKLLFLFPNLQSGKSTGIRRHTSDEIINPIRFLIPVDFGVFLKYFKCVFRLLNFRLWFRRQRIFGQSVKGFYDQSSTYFHHSIVKRTGIFIRKNRNFFLKEDISFVNLFIDKKSSESCSFFAVNHCIINRCSTTVIRKQGSVKIKRSQRRNFKKYFGHHPKGYDDEHVCIQR